MPTMTPRHPKIGNAPPSKDTTGYSVTENDLTIDDFSVDVSCASGYKGNLANVKHEGIIDVLFQLVG